VADSALTYRVQPGGCLKGDIQVPGDKSISHRAVMLAAIANGVSDIRGFLEGADCLATLRVFEQMGVVIERLEPGRIRIHGVGVDGLQAPKNVLNLGNSGTSMRLLSGLLVGQSFSTVLEGDASLCRRPMTRVTDPLIQMGARIRSTAGCAPLSIEGCQKLRGIDYVMSVASAQVKSALLLAGIYAEGTTTVTEAGVSRDHTERMLQSFSYPLSRGTDSVTLSGGARLISTDLVIPGDLSSAAFFLVGASIAVGSDVTLRAVGVNPTRIGVLNILQQMGADIRLVKQYELSGEPVADIQVKSAKLKGIDIPRDQVSLAIDEFPILFIAAACAEGMTRLRGAAELRVKECDRIQSMVQGLQSLGIEARALPDGVDILGGTMCGGAVNSFGDHRVAMAFSMAALCCREEIRVLDCESVATSFPNFVNIINEVGLEVKQE